MTKSGYHYLTTYMLATVIYDLTVEFCHRYLAGREHLRIREQKIHAARSGRQNIAATISTPNTPKSLIIDNLWITSII